MQPEINQFQNNATRKNKIIIVVSVIGAAIVIMALIFIGISIFGHKENITSSSKTTTPDSTTSKAPLPSAKAKEIRDLELKLREDMLSNSPDKNNLIQQDIEAIRRARM